MQKGGFVFIYLFTYLLICLFAVPPTFARDPYPNKPRVEYIVPPQSAQQPYDGTVSDPQTMMRTNGQRSDIISFSCFNPRESVFAKKYIYLTDPAIDTEKKANSACASHNPPYTEVRPPYLKNNKTTPECQGKTYDATCYDWPIGNFLGPHPKAGKDDGGFVTPLSYGSDGGPLNACGPNRNERCDCPYVPYGPPETNTWMIPIERTVNNQTQRCVAPPYSTSGPWWDWFIGEMNKIQNSFNIDQIKSVSVFLGMDGEGRPFKSGEGWSPDPGFYTNYVPAVIREVKKRYPGKTISAHYTRDMNFFLENDVDFHWESLSSDGNQEYLYKGLSPEGYDQIYQNYFYKTNTLGLNPDWPPFYQDVMNALSKHTDGITGFMDLFESLYQDGKGDFIKFAGSYMGKNINNTPGVWDNLRDTQWKKEKQGNASGKYGDYLFYLYRMEDLIGNQTVPVSTSELPPGTSKQIYNYGLPSIRYGYPDYNQFVGRKNAPGNNYMSFDIDDGYRYTKKTEVSFEVKIVYLDVGTDTFKFQYKDVNNQPKEHAITKADTKLWQETKFTVNDAYFNNNMSDYPYPTDFRLETNGTTFHLVEVIGKGDIPEQSRPKAQVSCALVKNEADDPREGLYSVGLNQNIKVKASLADDNGKPLPDERVMFTYNSEWNWAKSIKTNSNGIAFYDLSTANNVNRSGFVGDAGGDRTDLPSWYSIQVFYPGSDKYQPSRNDCKLPIYTSSGTDINDARMKIISVDTSKVASTGKAIASYQILNLTNGVIATGQKDIGKAESFFADDPNAQTVLLMWYGDTSQYRYAFNNITLNGSPAQPPFTPVIQLQRGYNLILLPHPAFTLTSSNIPCKTISLRQNFWTKSFVKGYLTPQPLQEGKRYTLSCQENTTW